ncbi:hypothetical protein ABCR94_26365 [Streptomyces sp. 21So2-11]|uniref:hypothetical protein n=1 Tax=Streptomyces sp. 21So2-11 TaxID=3144408 RepID=UPI00321BA3DE
MPPSGGAARAEGEAATQSQPNASSTGAPAASAQSGTTTSVTTEEAEASATAGSRQQAEPEAAANGRTRAQTALAAAPDAAVAAGVGGASGEGAGRGDDAPPSGNPKKPFLAAAGIAGVVLLAVPLLIWATDDSEKKDKVSVVAKSDTILEDEPMGAPQGDYAADKPKAEPKPKAKPKAQAKPDLPNMVKAVLPPLPSEEKESAPKEDGEPKKEAARSLKAEAPKPATNTAASAVQQLATQSPGRHICYRAFVANSGWQRAVCDGATAGTEGKGTTIKALDISVAGTNGTSATAYFHEVGWKNPWKSVTNGADLYIGTAKNSAVSLSGFAISVREGNICQNTHVSESGWLGLGCDTPQTSNNYIFGGAVEKKRTLEAVRFTV